MDNTRPFAGIEVVEFGQFIAVPFCAEVLSEGGAHVVKVESLEGDPVRQLAPLAPGETRHFISRNRGKHSLPLALRHPSAAPVVERLLARADVVLTTFRPGLAAELGLDWASLAPRYPRLVVGNVSAFGRRGPAARLAGMDLVVQARSGLLAAGGSVRDGVPTGGENPVVDYMCAMTLAFGIATALLRRATTGRGGEVDVSLLMAALMIQNNNMVRIESADGVAHAAIRAREKELQHYAALRRSVEAALASRTTAEWQATFEAAGIPAAGVKLPLELLDDEQPLANGMLHDLAHPALGRIRVLAPPVSMDGRGFVPAPATSPFGSETRAILGDLGFSSAEVGALLAEGVTREGPPPRG